MHPEISRGLLIFAKSSLNFFYFFYKIRYHYYRWNKSGVPDVQYTCKKTTLRGKDWRSGFQTPGVCWMNTAFINWLMCCENTFTSSINSSAFSSLSNIFHQVFALEETFTSVLTQAVIEHLAVASRDVQIRAAQKDSVLLCQSAAASQSETPSRSVINRSNSRLQVQAAGWRLLCVWYGEVETSECLKQT